MNNRYAQITEAIIEAVEKASNETASDKDKKQIADAVTAFLPLYETAIHIIVGDITSYVTQFLAERKKS